MITQEDILKANKILVHLTRDLFKPNIFLERVRKQVHYERVLQDIFDGKIIMKYKK